MSISDSLTFSFVTTIMARITIGCGGRGGSVGRRFVESNTESSHGRRRSNIINQVPHDPSKRTMISLDSGRYAYLYITHLYAS